MKTPALNGRRFLDQVFYSIFLSLVIGFLCGQMSSFELLDPSLSLLAQIGTSPG